MIDVPKHLKDDAFRFILLRRHDKRPMEMEWQSINNYRYDDPKLSTHLKADGNYGVCGGYGNLLIIDIDKFQYSDALLSSLPETFTVKTAGKGLFHLYYIVDEPVAFKITDYNSDDQYNGYRDTVLDGQGKGKQVVCAGSKLENGNTYEVIKDIPITKTTLNAIRTAIHGVVGYPKHNQDTPKTTTYSKTDKHQLYLDSTTSLPVILELLDIDISHSPTNCPFHESKAGRCLSWNNHQFKCHHCDLAGNIITLMKQYYEFEDQYLKELEFFFKDFKASEFKRLRSEQKQQTVV